jgi:hypothetical protein
MFYIQKDQNIQGTITSIFYEGDYRWSTEYEDRKVYNTQEEATTELYEFGGIVMNEE